MTWTHLNGFTKRATALPTLETSSKYEKHDSELATKKSGSKRKAVDPRGVEEFTDSNICEVAEKRKRLRGLIPRASEDRHATFTQASVSLHKVKGHVEILASPDMMRQLRQRKTAAGKDAGSKTTAAKSKHTGGWAGCDPGGLGKRFGSDDFGGDGGGIWHLLDCSELHFA